MLSALRKFDNSESKSPSNNFLVTYKIEKYN
jgi:hypothetical protein